MSGTRLGAGSDVQGGGFSDFSSSLRKGRMRASCQCTAVLGMLIGRWLFQFVTKACPTCIAGACLFGHCNSVVYRLDIGPSPPVSSAHERSSSKLWTVFYRSMISAADAQPFTQYTRFLSSSCMLHARMVWDLQWGTQEFSPRFAVSRYDLRVPTSHSKLFRSTSRHQTEPFGVFLSAHMKLATIVYLCL